MTLPVILDFFIFYLMIVELFNLEIPLTNIDLLIEYFKAEHY